MRGSARSFVCETGALGRFEYPGIAGHGGAVPHVKLSVPSYRQTVASGAAEETSRALCVHFQAIWNQPDYVDATALGRSSHRIQDLVTPLLIAAGYSPEVSTKVLQAGFRADFYREVDGEGILIEVERGRTIDNNMDMLDFWKCHLHPSAHHLVLVIPVWYTHTKGVKDTFNQVVRRLSPLFCEGFTTNVQTLNLVGY